PAADQHAPFWRVFNGIGNKVLDQPPQQPAIGPYDLLAWHENEVQPFGSGKRGEFELDLTHQLLDPEAGELGAQCTGVETRHVEQGTENFLNCLERGIDIVDESPVVASAAFNQAGNIKTGRVEWLQDVVTCRRQEFRFGKVGGVGLAFGFFESRIESGQ